MQFSKFGERFVGDSGILRLMDDLGDAAKGENAIMLGGGNPSHIPEVEETLRMHLERLLDSESDFEKLVGEYAGPAGHQPFIDALADMFQQEYGWDISARNIALTNGSQNAFFYLFNLLAGEFEDGSTKMILLPLAPEYIGYADVGISGDLFTSCRPQIEFLDDHLFKYHVDFDALEISDDIGAICVSRPTNPTGNVLTAEEIMHLGELAKRHNIPLIIDKAYGSPFPSIQFAEVTSRWEPHKVFCMSLSKLGLAGARTGIVLANEEIIQAITGLNAVISLAPNGFGSALTVDAVRTRSILSLSEQVIKPHYWRKSQLAVNWLRESLAGTDFFIHKPEGAFFLWVWFRDLPITSQELYDRLKARGVVVVPGHHFFPGLDEEWRHKQECIRVSYAGEDDLVHKGVQIIGEVARQAYAEG